MNKFDFNNKFARNIHAFSDNLLAILNCNAFDRDNNPTYRLKSEHLSVSCSHNGAGPDKVTVFTDDLNHLLPLTIFKSIRLYNCGGGLCDDDTAYCMTIGWRYEHFNGGTNGCRILRIKFNDVGDILEVHNENSRN